VLLVHGAEDTATPPDHSRRIFAALGCPKDLIVLEGVGHDDPLDEGTWERIEQGVERAARR
jgi:pimeloyl-ACP methyl ester carboxylesterase